MTPPFAPGEPVTPARPMRHPGLHGHVPMGAIRFVEDCFSTGSTLKCRFCGIRDGAFGVLILGITPPAGEMYCSCQWRKLDGTDIRRLETKYPEYIIKTNEVEG